MPNLIPIERIEKNILLIRGYKVMLDSTLSELYGVQTKTLIQSVKRNQSRFPSDFIFQLNKKETEILRSQFVTSNKKRRGGRRYSPYVFTEYGIAMLSSVLNSERAIQVNIAIMRAFMQLRRLIGSNKILAKKIQELEHKIGKHDQAISSLFETIHEMINPPVIEKRKIGFKTR